MLRKSDILQNDFSLVCHTGSPENEGIDDFISEDKGLSGSDSELTN